MSARPRHATAAFTLTEVVCAVFIVAALGVPILSNVRTAVHETAAGEQYMFAEALALEHLEQALAIPIPELARELPHWSDVPAHDDADRRRTARLKSFQARLSGPDAFRGQVQVEELAPALLRYTVTVEWPAAPGSSEMRRVALLRLRCPTELALKLRPPDTPAPHRAALEACPE